MKAFVASLILLGLMLLLIAGNALYVKHVTNNMEEQLGAVLQSDNADTADALWQEWCRARRWLRLSVPVETVNEIDDRLAEVCVAASKKDADELVLAVRLSLNAIRRMRDIERFCHKEVLCQNQPSKSTAQSASVSTTGTPQSINRSFA